ncbi:MAG: hypothetical protein ABI461_05865 [Polyangiaceae bacterium]
MTPKDRFFPLFATLTLSLAACSGAPTGAMASGATGGGDDAGTAAGDAGSGATKPTPDGGTIGAGTGNYIIVLHADQTPVAVDPTTSGETPSDQRIGFSGLRLFRNAADASPLVVADLPAPVDVGYNDGDDTVIATVPAKSLQAGHFTVAHVPIAYVRFTVAGTFHTTEIAAPGNFSDVISMADGAMIDGTAHDQGFWETAFSSTGGTTYGMQTGEHAVTAQPGATSGVVLDNSKSPSEYVFSTDLDVDPNLDHDVRVVFHVNTYQDFRWQDQSVAGYSAGTFDVSAAGFETVTQLGANSIATTVE